MTTIIALLCLLPAADIFPETGADSLVPFESILRNRALVEALRLTDEQYSELRELKATYDRRERQISDEGRTRFLAGEDNTDFYPDKANEQSRFVIGEMKRILTPATYTRLQQIIFHRGGWLRLMGYPGFVRQLELNEAEQNRWARALNDEYLQFSTLRNDRFHDAKRSAADVLTDEQHRRFEELFGERMASENPRLADSPLGNPFYYVPPRLQLLYLDLAIRREVQLLDPQYERVKALMALWAKEVQAKQIDTFGRISADDTKVMAEINKRVDAELSDELLDDQSKRLDQLVFQARALVGSPDPLRSKVVHDALKLTERQRAQLLGTLNQTSVDQTKWAEREIASLTRRMVLTLTPEQQARYHRLVGPPPR